MHTGLSSRLTLISAPPGFGKTTMVVDWHASDLAHSWDLAWVSLDENDNDLIRFLSYAISALQTIHPAVGEHALSTLFSGESIDPEIPLTVLLNDLGMLTRPVVLAFDDYHEIESPEVHRAMTFLVDHMPDHMRVVMTARTDPPLPLPRWRSRRDLSEFGVEDLRFTLEEASTFLNDIMGLDLNAAQVARLGERTEGWAAGLLLAALSADGQSGDHNSIIDEFSGEHHYIFDYLAEEVLTRQHEQVQEFLLRTSVLEQLSADLCNAVTASSTGQQMLERLEQANLFVVPQDQNRHWFRYHHLFGEFLEARLKREQPEGWTAAHRRAIDWYIEVKWFHRAIYHAFAIEDYEVAADLIERSGDETLKNGRLTTLRRWFSVLPREVVEGRRRLSLLRAWELVLDRKLDEAEATLDRVCPAEEPLDPDDDWGIHAAVARVTLYRVRGDHDKTVDLTLRALDVIPEDDLFNRSLLLVHLGTVYRMREDLTSAIETLSEAVRMSVEVGNIVAWLLATSQLAVAQMSIGDLRDAAHTYQQAMDFESKHGLRTLGLGIASHLGMGEIQREWNELDQAEAVIDGAFEIMEGIGEREELGTTLYGLIVRARLYFSQGRYAEALETVDRGMDLIRVRNTTGWQVDRIEAVRARILVALGRELEAFSWVSARGYSADDEVTFNYELAYQVIARLVGLQGSFDDALVLIEKLRALAVDTDRRRRHIEVNVIESVLRAERGETDLALELLDRALPLAERDRYVRVFADEGEAMGRLLAERLRRGDAASQWDAPFSRDYLAGLIEVTGTGDVSGTAATDGSSTGMVDGLTEREREVLQLLADGLSNREVAEQLFLSIGTVKRHTHNIYGKLGVASRTQALLRGRELGLLE